MFFDNSRPDRQKRAARRDGYRAADSLARSPVPPAKSYEFLTHTDLTENSLTLAFDVESYVNYFEVGFRDVDSGKVVYFEAIGNQGLTQEQCQRLAFILYRHRIVGFNSINYDLIMLGCALLGLAPWKLKEITSEIIVEGMRPYEAQRKYNLPTLNVNHIDIMEVAPIEASLKLYGARLHCGRLQDLPYEINAELTPEQTTVVRDYNLNDLEVTANLFNFLKPQIELREALSKEYNIDLRSKSDAQISEAVIGSELRKLGIDAKPPTIAPGTQFHYKVPDYIKFKTPQFQHVLETVRNAVFTVGEKGSVDLPPEIKALSPRLGSGVYRMGIGGLHSSEKSTGHVSDEQTLLKDVDVASFYPWLIINAGLYPEHLGPAFIEVFLSLVNRRLKAKGDAKRAKSDKKNMGHNGGPPLDDLELKFTIEADGLKITINGGFGKLGSKYSIFYAPKFLIQVTVTGQLSLLMLIEMIELAGIPVVSANTDGVVIKCPKEREEDLATIVMQWEEATGLTTEETRYKSIWSRDVNNYIAIKEDGECKTKGVYSEVGSAQNSPLSKNPEAYIVSMAVQQFLAHGVPVEETIENCGADVKTKYYPSPCSRFVCVKRVTGGAHKNGIYLGKVVRWYYAKGEEGAITSVTHNSTVGKTEGAKPLMEMGFDLPADIDLDWYVKEAYEALYDLGRYKRPSIAKLFG